MNGAEMGRLFLENAAIAAAGTRSVSGTQNILATLGQILVMNSPVYCSAET